MHHQCWAARTRPEPECIDRLYRVTTAFLPAQRKTTMTRIAWPAWRPRRRAFSFLQLIAQLRGLRVFRNLCNESEPFARGSRH